MAIHRQYNFNWTNGDYTVKDNYRNHRNSFVQAIPNSPLHISSNFTSLQPSVTNQLLPQNNIRLRNNHQSMHVNNILPRPYAVPNVHTRASENITEESRFHHLDTMIDADEESSKSFEPNERKQTISLTESCRDHTTNVTLPVGLRGSNPLRMLDRYSMLSSQSTKPFEYEATKNNENDISTLRHNLPKTNNLTTDIGCDKKDSINRQIYFNSIAHIQYTELILVQIIGGGGFGQVWKGKWLDTPVAIKMLNFNNCTSDSGSDIINTFEEEISMLSTLRHPNICLILGTL